MVCVGDRDGHATGRLTPHNPASTTNPQALPAGLSEWAILDSNPRLDAEGFEGQGVKRRRKRRTGGRSCRPEGGACLPGRGSFAARGRAQRATWRLAEGRAQVRRSGVVGGHGSSLARAHALGPTEELVGAIEFVSGGCHRCHRYRNRRRIRSGPSPALPGDREISRVDQRQRAVRRRDRPVRGRKRLEARARPALRNRPEGICNFSRCPMSEFKSICVTLFLASRRRSERQPRLDPPPEISVSGDSRDISVGTGDHHGRGRWDRFPVNDRAGVLALARPRPRPVGPP